MTNIIVQEHNPQIFETSNPKYLKHGGKEETEAMEKIAKIARIAKIAKIAEIESALCWVPSFGMPNSPLVPSFLRGSKIPGLITWSPGMAGIAHP